MAEAPPNDKSAGPAATALALARQADAVLRQPARERLELLLHAAQPMRLVRALPDGELYLTVREVGPHDALPLMALASASQIQHLIDLEAWRKDRFDAARAGAWVAFFLESGEPTVTRFLRNADDELLELLMAHWMRVHELESDEEPGRGGHGETEAGNEHGFVAPDGNHRFAPLIPEHAAAVRRVAELLLESNPARYGLLIRDAIWELPSELEERALQWRNSRMEEHGFPPHAEALDVFAPPAGVRGRTEVPAPAREGELASPRAVMRLDSAQRLLAPAIDQLEPETRERVLFETAAIANRILIAEQSDTGDPTAHRAAALSVAGFLEVALARRGAGRPEAAGAVLSEVPILELFREGLAPAVELRERAREKVRNGWPAAYPRALEILDAPLRGALSGLLLRRPMYFDTAARREEDAFREFRTLDELELTGSALELSDLVGRVVFDVLRWSMDDIAALKSRDGALPKASSLIATSLVAFARDGAVRSGAVKPAERETFLSELSAQPGPLLENFGRTLSKQLDASERQASLLLAFLRALVPSVENRILARSGTA